MPVQNDSVLSNLNELGIFGKADGQNANRIVRFFA